MIFYLLLLVLLLGSTLVFYSISPYYAALGLVVFSLFGCIVLGLCGVSFFALVLLLVYMGGMLVVFIYSSALSADRYPSFNNFWEIILLFLVLVLWVFFVFEDFLEAGEFIGFTSILDLDCLGELYSYGGLYVLFAGLILLVVLIVALIISFESTGVSLRAL
uniref:NADH-ubiquinone oxidoreductase chain 6 n=1 Tax=Colochirus quadrangularis TaxID=1980634 RepID=A0A7G7MWM5_9ECHN|nr:NADH dehydrogenase subunit 6 [Colochirus quadrangularis]QNG57234.1 NADH dehydrogenase subunit 6 [Colochirus quadrangularis]QQY85582.1 NADH dehydrogenase subunit 6 [Colochirus quadrangularis]